MLRLFRFVVIGIGISFAVSAQAQITEPRTLSATPIRKATLEEQLTNRLRATRDDQKAYIRFVVKRVEEGDLEKRLVLAVEKYSIRRNRYFPFPFFERAIRFEAAKRSVLLPSVQTFATTRSTTP
ncbi:MAG: hypothetical protein AAGG48_27595 [Planctomycetota bacterium]